MKYVLKYVLLIREPVRFEDWTLPSREGEYEWRWAPAYTCSSLPDIGNEEAIALAIADHFYVVKSTSTHLQVGDKIKRR
jgi:hypothetical protein